MSSNQAMLMYRVGSINTKPPRNVKKNKDGNKQIAILIKGITPKI